MSEKECIKDEELQDASGGNTWEPIDETCPDINNCFGCNFTSRRGRYDNCVECKWYK